MEGGPEGEDKGRKAEDGRTMRGSSEDNRKGRIEGGRWKRRVIGLCGEGGRTE
jgi:hypothetical protein